MRVLSLFSGIGLHDLGLERAGWEIAGQVEIDPWCRAVLEKNFPGVPRWKDVRDVDMGSLAKAFSRDEDETRKEVSHGSPRRSTDALYGIELVTGGFP